ncbi:MULTISPECIES: DUF3486 family protein [unclassified Moraxella]|uniref:DUF3486 family protein n=1 Tax=unclassified Moraxella TaxID=2685852 RepID=UPI003AF843C9
MARESAIDRLPSDVKKLLDDKLFENGFNGYIDLETWLREQGYEISKSSIHRYGQKVEKKLAMIQASTQAAMMIAEQAPDDADMRSQAVLSLVQSEIFDALLDFQNATDEENAMSPADRLKLLGQAGKGIANITTASVNQKKWQTEVKDKAQKAADAVENIVSKGGLNAETVQMIRREILGIAE